MNKAEKPKLEQIDSFFTSIKNRIELIPAINEVRLFCAWLKCGNDATTFSVEDANKLVKEILAEKHAKDAKKLAEHEQKMLKYLEEKSKANLETFEKLMEFYLHDDVTTLPKEWDETIIHEKIDSFSGNPKWQIKTTPRELLKTKGTANAIGELVDSRMQPQEFKKQIYKLYHECTFPVYVQKEAGKSHSFYCTLKMKL